MTAIHTDYIGNLRYILYEDGTLETYKGRTYDHVETYHDFPDVHTTYTKYDVLVYRSESTPWRQKLYPYHERSNWLTVALTPSAPFVCEFTEGHFEEILRRIEYNKPENIAKREEQRLARIKRNRSEGARKAAITRRANKEIKAASDAYWAELGM